MTATASVARGQKSRLCSAPDSEIALEAEGERLRDRAGSGTVVPAGPTAGVVTRVPVGLTGGGATSTPRAAWRAAFMSSPGDAKRWPDSLAIALRRTPSRALGSLRASKSIGGAGSR